MSKDSRSKKKARDADRWLSANTPAARTSDAPGYPCPRCGSDIGHPAQQVDHNATVHGGR